MRYNLLICTSWLCFSCSSVALAQLPARELTMPASFLIGNKSHDLPNKLAPHRSENLYQTLPKFMAQTAPTVPPGILQPPRQQLPPLPENSLPSPPPPTPLNIPQQVPTKPGFSPNASVTVKRIEVLGSTVFSRKELDQRVAPFVGKELSFEQLIDIRTAITNLYTSRGYTTSGAFLPIQDTSRGIVQVQVVEGVLERIDIQGLRRLKPNYVRSRIRLKSGTPLNIRHLEQALQLLQLNPLFSQVQADLGAGSAPGRNVLRLTLKEASTIHAGIGADNNQSPSIGSDEASASLSDDNVSGLGDRFAVAYGITSGLNTYDLSYSIPLNAADGTLSLRYNNFDSHVIEAPFQNLGIRSNEETFSLGYRQPLVRSPNREFALGLSLDLRREQTYILDNIPFSFFQGAENGRSKATVLRFSQDWVERGTRRVLSARSQFNFGLDALGATVNNTGTDGRFFSWIGQFQYVQSLGNGIISIARIGTQLTPNSLLPIEQFAIGGFDSVRGYRQNQRVGDNGVVGSLEVRFPLVNKPETIGLIQIAPFLEGGSVWSNNSAITNPNTLVGAGVGLRWQINNYFSARLDYGFRLNPIRRQGDSLQDKGLFFSVQFQPF